MKKAMLEHEARTILEEYGVKNVPGAFCINKEEMIRSADILGYPVVLKVVSPDVIHKSENGGVILDIMDKTMLEKAYDDMMATVRKHIPNADIRGVLVTKFVENARELIIGSINDEQFGPVVMVGLGGIFVEIFKDISFGIAPVTKKEARNMVVSLKSYPILKGIRGEYPINIDAICELIVTISNFVFEKKIAELDLNPVFCFNDEVLVGDARILLE